MKNPEISMRSIRKSFGQNLVLDDVDCDFFGGEVHSLIGQNGAGKSTLIKIISGVHTADSGSIDFNGKRLGHYSPGWARANGVATIYQELDLVPNLDAVENIFLGNEIRASFGRVDRKRLRRKAAELLASMSVSIPLDVPVESLGIAQQQMIAIAKSLAMTCRVMILDEPTAVFTKSEKDTLFTLVRRLKAQGIAIIFISHHMDEIFEISDRMTVFRDGKVAAAGKVDEFDHDSLVRHMIGRDISASGNRRHSLAGERVLEVDGLTDGRMVQSVSLHVNAGEIVGLAGLVGAGRSETARIIFGAAEKTGGEIRMRGRQVDPRSPAEAVRLGIAMVPEDRKRDGLVLQRTVGENIGMSLVSKLSRFGLVPWRTIHAASLEQIGKLTIRPAKHTLQVGRMSGGNQQKVVLGRWLLAGAKLLILDEPTRGIDIGARAEIYAVMEELRSRGIAILMISSDLSEIMAMSDRILVMARGRIAGEIALTDATEERILSLAFQTKAEELLDGTARAV